MTASAPVDGDAVVVLVVPYCNWQSSPLHHVVTHLRVHDEPAEAAKMKKITEEEEEEEEDEDVCELTTCPMTGPCPSPPWHSARWSW